MQLLGLPLVTLRVDRLSLLFGYIFLLAALLGVIYALHVHDTRAARRRPGLCRQRARRRFRRRSGDAVHLLGRHRDRLGVPDLGRAQRARLSARACATSSSRSAQACCCWPACCCTIGRPARSRSAPSGLVSPGATLIFLAFGIKCAFPLLHNWLQDAYPEATVTGTVLLSAFTTKVAVYALARGFAGTEILVPIGAAMTAFPIFYAVIENDLRRVLAYSLNNQLGFMVVGIGIGTRARPQRRGRARVRRHPVQGPAVHVDGRGAVPGRHGEGLRARRPLQVDAVDGRLLHRRRRVDFGLSAVQRLRDQIAW